MTIDTEKRGSGPRPEPYSEPRPEPRLSGIGRVLIAVYAVLALAALGRSFVQLVSRFSEAPIAYSLSAVAACVYVLATVALMRPGFAWYRVALVTVGFELFGVLTVGILSLAEPQLFAHDTVWSLFGRGYLFVPLVLPIIGLWWLRTHRTERVAPLEKVAL